MPVVTAYAYFGNWSYGTHSAWLNLSMVAILPCMDEIAHVKHFDHKETFNPAQNGQSVVCYLTRPVEQEICFSLNKTGGGNLAGSCATLCTVENIILLTWRQWRHWQSFYCENEIVVRFFFFACLNVQMILNGSHKVFLCSINTYIH